MRQEERGLRTTLAPEQILISHEDVFVLRAVEAHDAVRAFAFEVADGLVREGFAEDEPFVAEVGVLDLDALAEAIRLVRQGCAVSSYDSGNVSSHSVRILRLVSSTACFSLSV